MTTVTNPPPKPTYYKVKFVDATAHWVPPLYLVRASTPQVLDSACRGLVNAGVTAKTWVSAQVTIDVPSTILINDGESLKLGVDLTYDSDLSKIDWNSHL